MNARIGGRLLLLLSLTACRADAGDSGGDAHEHVHDTGAERGEGTQFVGCPDTIPAFDLGMSTTSADGRIKAQLRGASSVPPVRFLNDWTLLFSDAQGNPLSTVSLRQARAFMPVHGHYGTPDPRLVRHQDEPAVYDLNALNLFMRGPWQVQLAVSTEGGGETSLTFEVCVEE